MIPTTRVRTFTGSASPSGHRAEITPTELLSVRTANGWPSATATCGGRYSGWNTLKRVGGHRPVDVCADRPSDLAGLRGPAMARPCFAAGAVIDAQGRRSPFAWDRGGLGDERRMTYCAPTGQPASTPCRMGESCCLADALPRPLGRAGRTVWTVTSPDPGRSRSA